MSYPLIVLAERDAKSPITEELLGKYHDRDESIRWRQVGIYQQATNFTRTTNPETWLDLVSPFYIPRHAKAVKGRFTIDGNWTGTVTTAQGTMSLASIGHVVTISQNVNQYEGTWLVDAAADVVSVLSFLFTLEVSGTIGTKNIKVDSIDALWITDDSVTVGGFVEL